MDLSPDDALECRQATVLCRAPDEWGCKVCPTYRHLSKTSSSSVLRLSIFSLSELEITVRHVRLSKRTRARSVLSSRTRFGTFCFFRTSSRARSVLSSRTRFGTFRSVFARSKNCQTVLARTNSLWALSSTTVKARARY